MQRINSATLKKGFIISIDNIPVNMKGENYLIQTYYQLRNGSYGFIAGLNQLSMNMNINPNMWNGLADGLYSRSTYIPDFMYEMLKNDSAIDRNGRFVLRTIFTMSPFPIEGDIYSEEELLTRSLTG